MATTSRATAGRTSRSRRSSGRSAIGNHTAGLVGLALACAGLALLIALGSYDPHDPSLNTASSRATHNLVGPLGAILADLLLQSFGFAAALPGLTMLVWAWRLVSRRGMGSVAVRLASLLAAIPVAAAVLASFSSRGGVTWPTFAGPGGASGRLLAEAVLRAGDRLAGPVGEVIAWAGGASLAILLVALTLGLTVSEWRSAGRMAREAANATARGGRSGWRRMGTGMPMPARWPRFLLPGFLRHGFRAATFRDRPAPDYDEPMDIPSDLRPEYAPFEPEPPAGPG